MRHVGLTILTLAVFLFSCKQKSSAKSGGSYTISGKIEDAVPGEIIICRQQTMEGKPDTAIIAKDGTFTFKGTIDEPIFTSIYFPTSVVESARQQAIGLFLETGDITITAKKDKLMEATIKGGVCNKELNEIMEMTKPLGSRMIGLSDSIKQFYAANNTAAATALQQEAIALETAQNKALAKHIKDHPKSYTAAYLAFQMNSYETNLDSAESAFVNMDASIQSSYYGKKLKAVIDALKSTAIGTMAPAFTVNDLQGHPISLASFKGKYLLLDFWASWCGPCRQENPNVVKAYALFKNKNFTILSVSLDEDKAAWQQAIENDKLSWTQVSDLGGWKSPTAALYNIQSIPSNLLLDPTGKIVAKDLRGEDLINELNARLK